MIEAFGNALFTLSNHDAGIQTGSDPRVHAMAIDRGTVEGHDDRTFRLLLEGTRDIIEVSVDPVAASADGTPPGD